MEKEKKIINNPNGNDLNQNKLTNVEQLKSPYININMEDNINENRRKLKKIEKRKIMTEILRKGEN